MGLPQIVNKMEWKNSDSSTLFTNDILIDKSLTVKGNVILGDSASNDTLKITGVSRILNGHIYLEGSVASSSTQNTTQIVFGKSDSPHIAISSNTKALVLNPNTTQTTNQIVLYLDKQSVFPNGITTTANVNTGNLSAKGNIIASGNITGVNGTLSSLSINDGGDITLNQQDTDQFINFLYTGSSAGYDWRIGNLGSGSGDANYFVIQTNSTTASTWNNALRLGLTTLDAQFGGNVYPANNNTKTLGTSTKKWKEIYATTLYQGSNKVVDSTGGTENKISKFISANTIGNSNITDDGSTITLGTKIIVQGNGSSYNEGIRILPASNGWSNIFFSGDTTTSGTHSGGWVIGRRGAAGAFSGDIGDFTIENNESNGSGLTLHKNGNMTLYGNIINIAKKVQLFYNSTDKSLDFIFN